MSRYIKYFLVVLCGVFLFSSECFAGNKKIMSINAAKLTAERGLVETIHGLKLRATEEVKDMLAESFEGKTESKTSSTLKGVNFEKVVYDSQKDIAEAIATVKLDKIENINGDVIQLKGKIFRRVGFGTSTPASAGPLKALRAAEIDAYKQLMKRIVGFSLESKTTVENYILKSDSIKTKVMATLFMAEVSEYGWTKDGDAFIKMSINIKEISDMLGEKIVSDTDVVEVEGLGAQEDDFSKVKQK
ncbi:MAG: hypothetical protein PHN38_07900 [Sulfurospirillaceae bacterium]|nr:hypothetical protein [Sulfurospirillaceae bacterium]MDD3462629.1 hypothetical protein [Sulfurospirillaceae bacterium]